MLCCWGACQISKRINFWKTWSWSLEILQELMIKCLIRYWNDPLLLFLIEPFKHAIMWQNWTEIVSVLAYYGMVAGLLQIISWITVMYVSLHCRSFTKKKLHVINQPYDYAIHSFTFLKFNQQYLSYLLMPNGRVGQSLGNGSICCTNLWLVALGHYLNWGWLKLPLGNSREHYWWLNAKET